MNSSNQHIISKCRWQTSTEHRDTALQLQQKLSEWTNMKMPGEASKVFDKLCIPGQSWKIDAIELDLGEIDIDQLEQSLTERFAAALLEKLSDHSIWNDAANTLSYEAASLANIIETFLLYGVYPWNYRDEYGTVNELLRKQLKEAFTDTIRLIQITASEHEPVRKRMAFQLQDDNLAVILKGLEPTNHHYILQFTKDLTVLQEKKTIVQAGAGDFKRSLWLAVLNFIFSERGSVFNRRMFVQSTLSQMAAHYNIAYDVLLSMIRKVLSSLPLARNVQPELLAILNDLTEEFFPGNVKADVANEAWQVLADMLTTGKLARDTYSIDDLITGLASEDAEKFAAMLRQLTKEQWTLFTTSLEEENLLVLMQVMNKNQSQFFINAIDYLQLLTGACGVSFNKEKIVSVILEQLRSSSQTTGELLENIIVAIAAENNLPVADMLLRFSAALTYTGNKSVGYMEVAVCVGQLVKKEISRLEKHRLYGLIRRSLELLADHNGSQTVKQELMRSHSQLRLIMELRKKALVDFLLTNDMAKFSRALPFVLNEDITNEILQNGRKFLHGDLLLQVLNGLTGEIKGNITLRNALEREGIQLMIIHSNATTEYFLDAIIKQFSRLLNVSSHHLLSILSVNTSEPGNSNELQKLVSRVSKETSVSPTIMALLHQIEIKRSHKPGEIAKLLSQNDLYKNIIDTSHEPVIANNIMHQGWQVLQDARRSVMQMLIHSGRVLGSQDVINIISDLSWRCFLQYNIHKNDVAAFRQLLETSALEYFNRTKRSKSLVKTGMRVLKDGLLVQQDDILKLLSECLRDNMNSTKYNGSDISFKELMRFAFEMEPRQAARILAQAYSWKGTDINALPYSFEELCSFISLCSSRAGAGIVEINNVYRLFFQLADRIDAAIAHQCRLAVFEVARTDSWTIDNANDLFRHSLSIVNAPLERIISVVNDSRFFITPLTAKVVEGIFDLPKGKITQQPLTSRQVLHQKGLLEDVIRQLLQYRELPSWMNDDADADADAAAMIHTIIEEYPNEFLKLYGRVVISDHQLQWLMQAIPFDKFIQSLKNIPGHDSVRFAEIAELHALIGIVDMGLPSHKLRSFIYKYLLEAFSQQNWKSASVHHLFAAILWHSAIHFGIKEEVFLGVLLKNISMFSPALQLVIQQVIKDRNRNKKTATLPAPIKKKMIKQVAMTKEIIQQGIQVRNAGIVLLNNYIPLLFERLGLTTSNEFNSEVAREYAVNALQYLCTGTTEADEHLMVLNKVLCGMDISTPIQTGVSVTEEQKQLMNGLLEAVIGYWSVIGTTSVDGFRGNWIIRDGILRNANDKWELIVDKKAYDVLIGRSPFSFSIIKYPWMKQVMAVTWPY